MSPAEKSHKLIHYLMRKNTVENQPELIEAKHRYFKMGCPISKVLDSLNQVYLEIKESDVFKNLKIKPLNPDENGEDFISVFNKSLLAGYDPYQPIDYGDLDKFPKTTFIGYLYGRPVAFITYTIEEENGEKVGVIAGLGVIPEYRRRGVAKALIIKTATEIEKNFNVRKLICDVYEKNTASLNLVKKFGFKKEG